MSLAINRKQINESAFLGTGEPRQAVPKKGHPFYPGDEYAFKYTEYNAGEGQPAARLDLGLNKKDAEGFRLLPSGKRAHDRALRWSRSSGPDRDIGTLRRQGLREGRHQGQHADPRARPALPDAPGQRPAGRVVEPGHGRVPVHRLDQVRFPQGPLRESHLRTAVEAVVRHQRQGRRRAAGGGRRSSSCRTRPRRSDRQSRSRSPRRSSRCGWTTCSRSARSA